MFYRHGIQLSYTIMRYDNYLAFFIVQPKYQSEFDFRQYSKKIKYIEFKLTQYRNLYSKHNVN